MKLNKNGNRKPRNVEMHTMEYEAIKNGSVYISRRRRREERGRSNFYLWFSIHHDCCDVLEIEWHWKLSRLQGLQIVASDEIEVIRSVRISFSGTSPRILERHVHVISW